MDVYIHTPPCIDLGLEKDSCPREVILVPPQSLAVRVPCRTSGPCVPPPVCPSRHQALPSGIGPFLERSFDILRRPSALAADASHACRQGQPLG